MADKTSNYAASTPINFRGKLKKLDSEELYYFNDYFEDAGFTESEIAAVTIPYYIDAFPSPSLSFGLYIILFLTGIALLVKSLCAPVIGLDGSFCISCIGDILMTYYTAGAIPRAIPNSKIMWAYQNTVTHRTNGVKTGTTYNVMVFDELAPKGRTFSVANETVAQDVLNLYHATLPWIVVGYSDELKKLYNKDRAQFLQLRYNTCEHTAVEPGSGNDSQIQADS